MQIRCRKLSICLVFLFCTSVLFFPSNDLTGLEEINSDFSQGNNDHYAWEWLDVGGSVDSDSIGEMVVLPEGGVIISGSFKSSVTIDSCTGNMAPNSNSGWNSLFIAKINNNGSCDWINTVSGNEHTPRSISSFASQISIEIDANQSLYVYVAAHSGVFYFDNISLSISSGYIAKLSPNGSWEWASELSFPFSNAEASIALKSNGDIFVATANKIVTFDQSGQTQNEFVFTPSSGHFEILDLVLDHSDNIYLGGWWGQGSISININGTNTNYVSPVSQRLFVMKIDSNGDYEWFSTASYPTSSSVIRSISLGGNGSLYVSGYFYGYLEFGAISLSTGGSQRGFVAELNSTGGWESALEINSGGVSIANDVLATSDGGFLVTGKFEGILSMAPILLNPAGGNGDVFLLKFSQSKSAVWGLSGGSNSNDQGNHIGNDSAGNIYVSGESSGNLLFGGESTGGIGDVDVFLTKLSPDYDRDGIPDVNDDDTDNDFVLDSVDHCLFSSIGFQSITSFDHDGDGCEDSSEDLDDDNDGMDDYQDSCSKGLTGWISNATNDIDSDGCMDALEDLDDDQDGFEDYEDLCPREVGNSSYPYEMGCIDSDGDTRPDIRDPFPNDDQEWNDQDFDGVGDNADAFDTDPTQHSDVDGDGHGDNPFGFEGDWFPSDSTRWKDSDQDGVADEDDAFPNEPTQVLDSDGDGYGDDPYGERGDEFPDDPNEWADSDDDGVGDNADAFPFNPSQQFDSDGDGFGDNQRGSSADRFPNDSTQWSDIDGDGFGDNMTGNNSDMFPTDPTQHSDRDGDGYGDDLSGRLADLFPDNPTQWEDADGDGLGDNQSGTNPDLHLFDFDNDGYIDALDILPMLASPGDLDADGCPDEVDMFDDNPRECYDFDNDTIGDNEDTDDDGDGWSDTEEDRLGTDSKDPLSVPVDSFEVVIPGTSVGLGAWDLMGMFGGIPLFLWLAFGFVTRNSRAAKFENRLREARTRDELEKIALDWEYAMMMRLIGPHQGIRLERIRVELDDNMESMNQSLSSLKPDGDDQTHLVVAEMEQQGKIRESDLMDSDIPSKDMTGTQGEDGYEWLQHNGRQYYRQGNEPASDWEEWNASL